MIRIKQLITICLLTFICGQPASAQNGPGRGKFVADQLVLKCDPGFNIDSLNLLYGLSTIGHQVQTDVYLLRAPQGTDIQALADEIGVGAGVTYCQPNFILSAPEGLQRSSPFLDQQAILNIDSQLSAAAMRVPAAQTLSTGENVKIAIIDGGINPLHTWLQSKPGLIVLRYDYVDGDSLPLDEPGGSCSGHGTFVAGVVRLMAPGSDLYIYRVLDTAGEGNGFTIANAVIRALDDGCSVINLSLGMAGVDDGLDEALKLARRNEVVVVASAGNDSTNLPTDFPFPASRDYCYAITALDSINRKADFANYGPRIDFAAPGTWIYGPYLQQLNAWWDGTSFAAPFVTGLVGQLKAIDSSLTWDQIDSVLRTTSINLDSLNPDYVGMLGSGLISPYDALSKVLPLLRGDVMRDGTIDLSDLSTIVGFLTGTGSSFYPLYLGDVNCNGVVDLADLSRLTAYLTGMDATLCSGG